MESIPAEFIKNFVLIVAGLAALAVYGKELFGGKKRREVSFEFEPASKVEFEKHVEWNRREHENLYSKIGGVERGIAARCDVKHEALEARTRSELLGIHNRINDVLSAVSNLSGKIEQKNHDDERTRH